MEEVISRNFLVNERPDAIINIIDGTNLERNLYLTTQIAELGIPMIVAVNMIDIVQKKGNKIHLSQMAQIIGCQVYEISVSCPRDNITLVNLQMKILPPVEVLQEGFAI